MKYLLIISGMLQSISSFVIFSNADNSIHQILACAIGIIAAINFAAGVIIDSNEKLTEKLTEKLSAHLKYNTEMVKWVGEIKGG